MPRPKSRLTKFRFLTLSRACTLESQRPGCKTWFYHLLHVRSMGTWIFAFVLLLFSALKKLRYNSCNVKSTTSKCTIQWCLVCSHWGATVPTNSRTQLSPQEGSPYLLVMVPSSSLALANNTLLSVLVDLSLRTFCLNRILQYGAFHITLLSLRMFQILIPATAHTWLYNPPGSFLSVIWNWPLYTERGKRPERAAGPCTWAGAVSRTAKGADMWVLSWTAAMWLGPCTCLPNRQFIKRPQLCSVMNTLRRCSQCHIIISRLCPWGSLWGWERQAEPTFQGQRREGVASARRGLARGAIRSYTAQWRPTALQYRTLSGHQLMGIWVFLHFGYCE